MKPHRVQRRRLKGWRMPANTVYVGRQSKHFGNPHEVGVSLCADGAGGMRTMTAADALAAYRQTLAYWTSPERGSKRWPIETLRGKNLACWCPLDQPCHADVLLEIANG